MRFVLQQPIHLSANASIPTGATGRIRPYDDYHLILTFDVVHKVLCYWDNTLILDKYDTEPEIWSAIGPEFFTQTFDEGTLKCEKAATRTIFANCT
jgi:hypothetical protein